MKFKINVFLLCPVPDDQKPINEYIELKENFLINWTTYSNKFYIKKLTSFSLLFFIFIVSFQLLFKKEFSIEIIENQQFFLNSLNFYEIGLKILIFLILYLLIIISLWLKINNQFKKSFLLYEESSWFDLQIWQKPFFLIKNDQLLSKHKIEPILQRLFQTMFSLLFFILISFFLWFMIYYYE